MYEYYIDFSASIKIKADTPEDAKEIFWEKIKDCGKLVYIELNTVEEADSF